MKNGFLLLFLVCVMLFQLSCKSDRLLDGNIRYGTYFGECIGYCSFEMTISARSLDCLKTSFQEESQHPPVSRHVDIGNPEWKKLSASLSFQALKLLPDTIGCPDCADGGAEWVEFNEHSSGGKKVVFDFGNAPDTIKEGVEYLRILRKLCEEKENEGSTIR